MTIKTETRTVEITLKQWNGENACWSCDLFDDLETSFASTHQCAAGEILDSTDGDYSLDVTEELA